jgi:hypothetical protein
VERTYHVEISYRFTALENLGAEVDINIAWENSKILAKDCLGYYEFKKHKPCFEDGCESLLNRKKQAKLAVVRGNKRNKLV